MMTFQCAECHHELNINQLAFTFSYHDENGLERMEGVCGDCVES